MPVPKRVLAPWQRLPVCERRAVAVQAPLLGILTGERIERLPQGRRKPVAYACVAPGSRIESFGR